MHIGIYLDFAYFADAEDISTDQAVVLFALALAPRVGEVTLFGRLAPEPGRGPYSISGPHVRFRALPHYPSLTALWQVGGAIRGSCAVFRREVEQMDAVWLFAPGPLQLAFAAIARRRGVPVIFGLRQDTPRYFAHRLPSRRWLWVVAVAHALDALHRLLARRVPTTVVGDDLARKYGAGRNPVLQMGVSLVRRSDLVTPQSARERSWDGELRLLSVGRVDGEKNPLLLADVVAELRSRDLRWTLDVVGDGPLLEPLRQRARDLGVEDAVRLHGYVANGAPLQALYRRAHAFVHVSLTEGLPQVVYEAQAAGLPIAGTDVGGVSAALLDGRAGLLVPPRDAHAMAQALERLRDEPALRGDLVEAGLRSVASHTMDVQVERVAAFMREHLQRNGRPTQVLMYHDVLRGPDGGPSGWEGPVAARYKIDLRCFEEHLDEIAATGATVGLLDPAGGGPDVALTFDDGGASALIAAEALERRNWRGHFFITTERIGTPGFLDADGVRALARRGHVVGSHSHTHPSYIARLPESQILGEWERSRDVLDETLGARPVFASVPGGMHSSQVASAARSAGYELLLTSEPRSKPRRFEELTVLGRFAIRSGTPTPEVVGYATGSRLVQGRAWLKWRAKIVAKRMAPRLYRIATGAPESHPSAAGDATIEPG